MFEFFKRRKPGEPAVDKVAGLAKGDEVLSGYREQAQRELPYLIDFMDEHGDGQDEYEEVVFKYAVKTEFNEEGASEHMWVQVEEFKDDYFIGKLANTPSTIKKLKYGDPIWVFRKDVEDWVLQDLLTGTKVGGFSSNYIRNNAKQ